MTSPTLHLSWGEVYEWESRLPPQPPEDADEATKNAFAWAALEKARELGARLTLDLLAQLAHRPQAAPMAQHNYLWAKSDLRAKTVVAKFALAEYLDHSN